MIEDLRKFDNLGSPNTFIFLFKNMLENKKICWKEKELNHLFLNKYIDGQFIFDGCVKFALKINVLCHQKGCIFLHDSIEKNIENYEDFVNSFNDFIFKSLKSDPIFHEIFKTENLSYDVINNLLLIRNSAFVLRYSSFKQLLINFNVLQIHPESIINSFVINPKYKYLFDNTILPEIRRNQISVEEFQKSMELKQKNGLEAEQFVINFENKRLNKKKNINWIAEYIVNAGYDIVSYNSVEDACQTDSLRLNLLKDKTIFLLVKNESRIENKKNQYWLYLVNRNKINDINYHPIMINNPNENILKNDDWIKSIENYKVSFNGATDI